MTRLSALMGLFLFAGNARANLMFTMQEVGPDVILSSYNSIDTTGLTSIAQWFAGQAFIGPADAHIVLGANLPVGNSYLFPQGYFDFGPGLAVVASSFTGAPIDLYESEQTIGLPAGYVSGSPISPAMTFAGQSFETLGVRLGTYASRLEDGQTITVNIGNSLAVPEPSGIILLGTAILRQGLTGSGVVEVSMAIPGNNHDSA